jgi:hypothetical protein
MHLLALGLGAGAEHCATQASLPLPIHLPQPREQFLDTQNCCAACATVRSFSKIRQRLLRVACLMRKTTCEMRCTDGLPRNLFPFPFPAPFPCLVFATPCVNASSEKQGLLGHVFIRWLRRPCFKQPQRIVG